MVGANATASQLDPDGSKHKGCFNCLKDPPAIVRTLIVAPAHMREYIPMISSNRYRYGIGGSDYDNCMVAVIRPLVKPLTITQNIDYDYFSELFPELAQNRPKCHVATQ